MSAYPLRLTVYRSIVHAVRASFVGSQIAHTSACGAWFHDWRLRHIGVGMVSSKRAVTCKACLRRLKHPKPSEKLADEILARAR